MNHAQSPAVSGFFKTLLGTPNYARLLREHFHRHSHSIVLGHGNALNFQSKSFLWAIKNRLAETSQICALDFKHEF